jgi:hypothetical protein
VVDQKQPVPSPGTRWSNPFSKPESGAGCGWAQCNFVHVDEQNNTVLHAQFDSWGLPCTFAYGATLQYYVNTGKTTKSFTIKGPRYGNTLIVSVPGDASNWNIKGQAIDFDNIFVFGSFKPIAHSNYKDLIKFMQAIPCGKNIDLYYQIGTPQLE